MNQEREMDYQTLKCGDGNDGPRDTINPTLRQ